MAAINYFITIISPKIVYAVFWFLELQIITLIAIVISSVVLEAMSQVRDEACETLQTEIHVTKGEETKTT